MRFSATLLYHTSTGKRECVLKFDTLFVVFQLNSNRHLHSLFGIRYRDSTQHVEYERSYSMYTLYDDRESLAVIFYILPPLFQPKLPSEIKRGIQVSKLRKNLICVHDIDVG